MIQVRKRKSPKYNYYQGSKVSACDMCERKQSRTHYIGLHWIQVPGKSAQRICAKCALSIHSENIVNTWDKQVSVRELLQRTSTSWEGRTND